ncbi:hypothetical protein LTS15_010386 [Exophiala xenobiotica]|nr:hypothetical protein LTS15_010386 [Exophiala xenobiotica]
MQSLLQGLQTKRASSPSRACAHSREAISVPPNATNRNKENCKWVRNDDLARSSGPIVGSADAEADYDSLTDEDSGEVLTPSQSGATMPLAMDSASVVTRQHSETPSINKPAGTKRPAQERANQQFRSSDSAQPKTQQGTIPPRDQQENLIMEEDLSTEQSGIVAPTNDIVFPNLDFFDPFLGLTYGTSETFGFDEDLGQLETFSPLTQLGGSNTQQTHHARRKNDDGGAIAPFNTQPPLSTLSYEARTPSERVAAPFLPRAMKCLDNPSSISKPSPGSTSSTTSSMPRVVKPSQYKRIVFGINATTRTLLYTDLSTRLTQDELWDFEFPDATTLDKCLRSYADAFHVHLPILHLSSLAVAETPSPLVLMICAIGALYRLERKLATSTYRKASQAFNRSISSWLAVNESLISIDECGPWPEEKSNATSLPLWMMQTRFLLAAFSSLNGNAGLIKRAFTLLGAQWIVSLFFRESSDF